MTFNPYQAPSADLTLTVRDTKKSIWWKVYFFFITGVSVLGLLSILGKEGAGLVDYFLLILFVVATIGFAGFVFNKKFVKPGFWLCFTALDLLYSIAHSFITHVDMQDDMTQGLYIFSIVIGWLLALPQYWGLFQYGRASNPPWLEEHPS
jgi:hypothetical protein